MLPLSLRRLFPRRLFSSMPMGSTSWAPATYPATRRSDHVEIYNSTAKGQVRVPDPFRWLEDASDETDRWTTAQAAYTRTYLDRNPDLPRLEAAFKASNNYAKFSAPVLEHDGRWYWYYNSGLDPQMSLYRSKGSELPDFSKDTQLVSQELFFDANALTKDGTASLVTCRFSKDGKWFAYGISYSGSDFYTIYIRSTDSPFVAKNGDPSSLDSGRLADEIKFVKFSSITWSPDSKGIFYQRYPDNSAVTSGESSGIATKGDRDAMVYYHRIGTPQSEDILIHKDALNPEWLFGVDITEDGRYISLYIQKDSSRQNLLWVAEYNSGLIGKEIKWNKIINEWGAEYDVVANKGSVFYLRTNHNAPRYKLITIDLNKPNERRDLIPQSDASISSVSWVNHDYLIVVYKRNVKDEVYLFSLKGEQVARVAEGFVGACLISGHWDQSWFTVTMHGFTTPGSVGRYDFKAPPEERFKIIRKTSIKGLVPDDFEATQVWYSSKDGTKIPMFIVRHKSTPFDGTAPAIQYGYGGFSVSIDPFFSASILTFMQRYGAILAVPNIRGGGEFGEEWHQAGILEKKGNSYDDFIAATEYLVKNKYAAASKVAINGASNGGLLVAASMLRAPEGTFGAAVSEVGVHDLLKFHRFTIGKAWTCDYGNPDEPKDFDFIYPISPVHNVVPGKVLPPTLLLTADHDDRVVPMHSFKFAATLQQTVPNNRHPLLLRVDKKAGHGAGKSVLMRIKEAADKWGFVAQSLGLTWREPESGTTERCNL